MPLRRIAVLLPLVLAACQGNQSVLNPAGKDASILADLFWVLLAGAIVLWVLVNGLFFYVTRIQPRSMSRRLAETLVIGGGIIFPVLLLGGLLSYSLSIMPEQREPGGGLIIRVTGEQWWWRVEYLTEEGGEPIVAANEIRLPLGKRTEIMLGADKVIHSFWIPALAGKMDMFPGRETRMALEPEREGIYRGQCAEFCGESHALMAFQAVVMPVDEFALWLEQERGPATEPTGDAARRGKAVFMKNGCGACHTIRGTQAAGKVGPDLTHVGGRETLAAGTLLSDAASFSTWIRHAGAVKPGAKMPEYTQLTTAELEALGSYLAGLN